MAHLNVINVINMYAETSKYMMGMKFEDKNKLQFLCGKKLRAVLLM